MNVTIIKKIGTILFILTTIIKADCQPYFRNYTVEDGLPSNETYQVFQDSKGYIWVGTDRGVSRFNGYEFENFSTRNGLPDNTVFAFYEDPKGRIWFNTFNGHIGYFENGKFYHPVKNKKLPKHILSILVESDDRVYITYNQETGSYYTFLLDKDTISKLVHDPVRVTEINYSGNSKIHFAGDSLDINGEWQLRVHEQNYKVQVPYEVNSFTKDGENVYITSLNSVLLKYKIGDYDSPIEKQDFFPYRLSSVLIDRNGGIWLSSTNDGILYKPKSGISVANKLESQKEGEKVSHVYKLGNITIIGHESGRIVIEKNKKKVHDIRNASHIKEMSIYDSVIYITDGTYIYAVSNNKEVGKLEKTRVRGISSVTVLKDHIWGVASSDLLLNIKWRHDSIRSYSNPYEIRSRIVLAHHDTLWIGGMKGLSFFNLRNNAFGKKKEEPKFNVRIQDMQLDRNGILFMASRGGGLLIKKGGECFQITKENGLASDLLDQVLVVDSDVWVSLHNGLSKVNIRNYHPFKYSITNFSVDDGLLLKQVRYISYHGDSIYVVTGKGINVLHKDYEGEKVVPELYIDGFLVNSEAQQPGTAYELSYDQSDIQILFRALYYPNPKEVIYKYRLKSGNDHEWHFVKERSASFTNLPPGNYMFEVQAVAPNNRQASEIKKIDILVHPPFWLTWWFKTLAVLILIALVYLFFRVNILTYNRDVTRKLLIMLLSKLRSQKTISVKNIKDGANTTIPLNRILFIKSDDHYAIFHLEENKTLSTRSSFKELLEMLNGEKAIFMQVHRSYLVNKNKVEATHGKFLKISSFEIPVGRTFRPKTEKLLSK